MTNRHIITSLLRRDPDQRTQIRRRDDLARDPITPTFVVLVGIVRLAEVPSILARELARRIPRLTRLVPDADLDVADAPGGHRVWVQRWNVAAAGGGLVVGAGSGAEEEVGAGGPVIGEDRLEQVVVVFLHVAKGGEAVGGIGARVVPPGAADAVGVVGVALDEVRGGQGAIVDELLDVRVARQGDHDVARGQAGCNDVGLEGRGQVLGFGLEVAAGGDKGSVGGEESKGGKVVLHQGERVGDVLLVCGFDDAEAVVDVADLDNFRIESPGRVELLKYSRRLPQRRFGHSRNGLSDGSGKGEQRRQGGQSLQKVAKGLFLLQFRVDSFDNLAYWAAGREVCVLNCFVDGLKPLPYGEDGVEGIGLLRRVTTEVFWIIAHARPGGVALLLLYSYRLLVA